MTTFRSLTGGFLTLVAATLTWSTTDAFTASAARRGSICQSRNSKTDLVPWSMPVVPVLALELAVSNTANEVSDDFTSFVAALEDDANHLEKSSFATLAENDEAIAKKITVQRQIDRALELWQKCETNDLVDKALYLQVRNDLEKGMVPPIFHWDKSIHTPCVPQNRATDETPV